MYRRQIRYFTNQLQSEKCRLVLIESVHEYSTELDLSKLKKITASEPQPHRTVFKYFAIFKNVVHSFSLVRRRVTRRLTRLQTTYNVLKYRKHGEITTKDSGSDRVKEKG